MTTTRRKSPSKPKADTTAIKVGPQLGSRKSTRTTGTSSLPALIFERYEYGATDSWAWQAWLSREGDGLWSLRLQQMPWETESDLDAEPAAYELTGLASGTSLFDFMCDSWFAEHEEGLDEQAWSEIVVALRLIDATLAEQVSTAALDRFNPEVQAPSPPVNPLQQCIAGATRQKKVFGGGGTMWASVADANRGKQAIAFYARRYLEAHQALPRGTHRVRVTFGSIQEGADCVPGTWSGGPGVFDEVVCYPNPL